MTRMARRRNSGLTLLEMVLALALTATLAASIGYSFLAGIDQQRTHAARQATRDTTATMERRIAALIAGAKLTDDSEDATTFFIGEADANGDTGDLGCDRLTFTTTDASVPSAALTDEDEFEDQHQRRGPIGGVAEVSFGISPIGEAADRSGLFLRIQRPADGDPEQGGMETVLSPDVNLIGFRFWDGTQWADTWSTITGERRLPALVRVTYTMVSRPDSEFRSFDIAVPGSDIDSDNPLSGGLE